MHKSLKRFSILLAFMTLCTSSPAFADVVATAQTGENSKVSIFERLDSANYPDSYYNDEFTWSDVNQQVIDKSYPEGDPRRYTLPWGRKRKGIINGNEVGSIGLREKQLTGRDWMIVNPNYKPKQGTPLYDDEVKAFNNGNILWNKVSKAVYDKWMSFENGPGDSPFYETGEYGTIKQLSVAGKNYGEVKTKEAHKVWVTTSERPQDYKDTNGKPYEYDADTDNVFNLDKTKKTQLNALVKDPYGDNKTDYQYTRSRYQVVVRHKARGTDHHSEYYINGRSYASNDPTVPAYKFEANVTPKLNISEEYLDFKPFGKITSWDQYKDQIDPQGGWMFKTAYESWGFEDYDYTGENGYILYDFDKDTFYNHADDGTYPLAKHDAIEGANVPSSGGVVRPYEEGMFQKYDPTRNLYTQIPNPGNYKNYQLYKYFIPATTKTSNYTVNDLPSIYTKTGKYVDQKPEEDSKEWTYKERVTDVDDINNSDFTYGLFHSHKLVKGQLDSYSSSPYFGTHFNMDQTYVNARTHAIVRGYIRDSEEPALYAADNPYNNMWNNLWFTDGTFTVPRTGSARTQDIDDANFKPQFMSWDPNFEYYKALKTALLKADKITTAGKDTFTIQNPSFKTSGTATFDKNNMYTVSSKDITEPVSVWSDWKDDSISVTIPSGNFYYDQSSVRSQLQNFLNSYNSLRDTSTRQYSSINNPSISTYLRCESNYHNDHTYHISGSTTSVVSELIDRIYNYYYDHPYNHHYPYNHPYYYDNYMSSDVTKFTVTYKYRDLTTTQEKVGTAYTVKLNGTLVAPGSLGDSASDYQKFLELSYNERSSNTNYVGTGAWFKAIFKEYSKAALYQDYDHKTLTSRPGEQGWVQPARDMNFQPRSHERKQYFTFDIYTRELAADGNTYYTYNTPIAMFDDNADTSIKKLDGVEVTGTKARTRSEDLFQYLFRTNFIYDALQEYMDWTPNNNFYTDKLDTKSDSDKNAVNEKYFNRYTSRTSTEKVMRDGAEVEVVKATKALSKEFSYFPYTDASNVNFTYNNNILQKYSLWLTQKGMTYEDFCKYGKDSNGKQVPISYNNKGIKIYNTEDVIFQQVLMNNHGETVQAFVPANNQTRSLYANVHFDSDEGNNVVDDEFEVWPSGIKEIKAACTAGDYANLGYVQFLNTDSKVGDTKKVSGRSYTHSTNFDPYLNGAVVYPTKNRYNGVIERPVYETQEKDIYGVIQNVEIPTVHYYTVLVNPLGYTLDTVNCAAAVQQEDIIDESHHDSLANFLNMASATFAFTDGKDTDTHINPAWCYNVAFKVNGNAKLDYEASLGDNFMLDSLDTLNRSSTGLVAALNYYSYENFNKENQSYTIQNTPYVLQPTTDRTNWDYANNVWNGYGYSYTGSQAEGGMNDVKMYRGNNPETKTLHLDANGIIINDEFTLYAANEEEAKKIHKQSQQKPKDAELTEESLIRLVEPYHTKSINVQISDSGLNELELNSETIKNIKGYDQNSADVDNPNYYKPSTIYFPRLYNKDLVFEKMKINGVYDYYDTNKDPLAQTQDFENNTKNIQYMSTLPRFNNQNMTLTQATDTALALKTQIHIPNVFAGTPVMLLALPEYEQGLHHLDTKVTKGLEVDYYVNHPDFKNITVRADNSIEENKQFQIRTYTNLDSMGINRCMFIMPTQNINITFNSDTVDVVYAPSVSKQFELTSLDEVSNFYVNMYNIVSKGTTGLTAGFLHTTPYTQDVTDGIDLIKDEDYIIQNNNNAANKDRVFWVPSKYQYKSSYASSKDKPWSKSKKDQFYKYWYDDYGTGFHSDYESNSYAYVKNKKRIAHYNYFKRDYQDELSDGTIIHKYVTPYEWYDKASKDKRIYIYSVVDSERSASDSDSESDLATDSDQPADQRLYSALYIELPQNNKIPYFTLTPFAPGTYFSSYPGIKKNTIDDYIQAQLDNPQGVYTPLAKATLTATEPTSTSAPTTYEYNGGKYWDVPVEFTDILDNKHIDVSATKNTKIPFITLDTSTIKNNFVDIDNIDNKVMKAIAVSDRKDAITSNIEQLLSTLSIRDISLDEIVQVKPSYKTLRKKKKIGQNQTVKQYSDGKVVQKQKLKKVQLNKLYTVKKMKYKAKLSRAELDKWLQFASVRDMISGGDPVEDDVLQEYYVFPEHASSNSYILKHLTNFSREISEDINKDKPDNVSLEGFKYAVDNYDYRLALSYLGLPLLTIQPVTIGTVNKKLMDSLWKHVNNKNETTELRNKVMQNRQIFSTAPIDDYVTNLLGYGTYMFKNGNGIAFGFGKDYSIFQSSYTDTTDLYAYYRGNPIGATRPKVLLFDIFTQANINPETGKLKRVRERNEAYTKVKDRDPDEEYTEPKYEYSYHVANGRKLNTILNSNSSYVAFVGYNKAKSLVKKSKDITYKMPSHLSLYGSDDDGDDDDIYDPDEVEDQTNDTGNDTEDEASDDGDVSGLTEDPDTEKDWGQKGLWSTSVYTIDGSTQEKARNSKKYAKQVYGFSWSGNYMIGLTGSGSGSKSKRDSYIIMQPNETGQIINVYGMNSSYSNPVAMVMRDNILLLKETNNGVMLFKCTLTSSNYFKEVKNEYNNIMNKEYDKDDYTKKEIAEDRLTMLRALLLNSMLKGDKDDTTVIPPAQTANLYTNTNDAVKNIIPGFMIGSSDYKKYGDTNYIYYSGNYTWEASTADPDEFSTYSKGVVYNPDGTVAYVQSGKEFYDSSLKQAAKEAKKKYKVKKKKLNSNNISDSVNYITKPRVAGLENVPLDSSNLIVHGTGGAYPMQINSSSKKSVFGVTGNYKADIDYYVLSGPEYKPNKYPQLSIKNSYRNINMNGIEHMGYIIAPQPVNNDEQKRTGFEVVYSGSYVIPYLNMFINSFEYSIISSAPGYTQLDIDNLHASDYNIEHLLFYLMNGTPVQSSDTLLQYFMAQPMLFVNVTQWYGIALDPGICIYRGDGCRFSNESYIQLYDLMLQYSAVYNTYAKGQGVAVENADQHNRYYKSTNAELAAYKNGYITLDNKNYRLTAHKYLYLARDLQTIYLDPKGELTSYTFVRRKINESLKSVQPFINLKSTDIDLYFSNDTLKVIDKNQGVTDKQYKYNTYINTVMYSGSKDINTPVVVYPQYIILKSYFDTSITQPSVRNETDKILYLQHDDLCNAADVEDYTAVIGEFNAFLTYLKCYKNNLVTIKEDIPDLSDVIDYNKIYLQGDTQYIDRNEVIIDNDQDLESISNLEYLFLPYGSPKENVIKPYCGFTTNLAMTDTIDANIQANGDTVADRTDSNTAPDMIPYDLVP